MVTSSSSGLSVHDGDFQGNDGTDCVDHSAGGGTAGTANTWAGNVGDESDPDGLCAVPVPNHAPDVTGATASIPEDSANGALVANPTFTDSDPGQSHVWSITGGNAGGAFGIDPTTGTITVADHTALDFETRPSYALTVRVTDDGTPAKHGEATVTVNLTDVNEPPVVHPATFGIFEDAANGDVVGHVTFTDPDAGQTGTYSIQAGNTGGAFAIDASNGNITVADHTQLNATTLPQYSLTVRVTDNGSPQLFGEATITIDVSHPNQPPVVNPASFTVPEGSANGTVVGTVTSTDSDAGQTLTYSIEAGNSGGAFGIDPTSGAISVANHNALDFETKPTYALTVRATDNGTPAKHGEATVTVTVTDVNEPPIVDPATFSITEAAADGDPVGTVTFSDPDAGQTGSFSIESGNSTGIFAIGAASGQITVADHTQLNAGDAPVYSLTVRVTDNGSPVLYGEATITSQRHAPQPGASGRYGELRRPGGECQRHGRGHGHVHRPGRRPDVDLLHRGGQHRRCLRDRPQLRSAVRPPHRADQLLQHTLQPHRPGDRQRVPAALGEATITVTVTGTDDPPTAVDDSATVTQDSGATAVDVLANDTDPDGGAKSITAVTQSPNGTVVITGGGTGLTYAPNGGFCNNPPGTTDDFTYTLNGGSTATVHMTVDCLSSRGRRRIRRDHRHPAQRGRRPWRAQ